MTRTTSTEYRPAGRGLGSRTWVLDDPSVDPLAALGPGGFAWFADGLALATSGVAARVGVDEAAGVLAGIAGDDPLAAPGSGPLAVGALRFDGRGELVIPARIAGRGPDGRAWVTEVGPATAFGPRRPATAFGPRTPATAFGPRTPANAFGPRTPADETAEGWPGERLPLPPDRSDRLAWTAAVEEALARIADGRLEKVVLARQVTVDLGRELGVATVVDRLRREQPSCFTCAVGNYVGASPELLVRRRGRVVVSRPLAGTAAQGGGAAEDRRLVAAMAESVKEQFEHRLVVRDVCAALREVCDDVTAGDRPDVVRLSTVAHLATTVTGRLRDAGMSALAVAVRLHPTPAVAGVPRAAALSAIAALEDFDRGLYAGPVGWVDGRGDGDWAVALRGATLDGARARLVAGAGIVAGSDPDAEWAETEAKLAAMRSALAGG